MIEIIGAGFGRTGTSSLKRALEILGFDPCYHFTEMMKAGHLRLWLNIASGKTGADWDKLLQNYKATTDWPAASYCRDLARHYPEAKLILTERNPEDWYRSARETIYPLSKVIPAWLPGIGAISLLTNLVIWNGTFGGRFEDKAHAIAVFNQHNEDIVEEFPPSRLLRFNVKEGWRPLCEFLGVAIPDVPFPHENEARVLRDMLYRARAIKWSLVAAAAIVALGFLWNRL